MRDEEMLPAICFVPNPECRVYNLSVFRPKIEYGNLKG